MQKVLSECPFCFSQGIIKGYCSSCQIQLPSEGRMVYKTTYAADPDPHVYIEEQPPTELNFIDNQVFF